MYSKFKYQILTYILLIYLFVPNNSVKFYKFYNIRNMSYEMYRRFISYMNISRLNNNPFKPKLNKSIFDSKIYFIILHILCVVFFICTALLISNKLNRKQVERSQVEPSNNTINTQNIIADNIATRKYNEAMAQVTRLNNKIWTDSLNQKHKDQTIGTQVKDLAKLTEEIRKKNAYIYQLEQETYEERRKKDTYIYQLEQENSNLKILLQD